MSGITRVVIAALGGEGGGVLCNWLVQAAREHNYWVQATSVPGVAQRTGSTSYYIEWASRERFQAAPLFALSPTPGLVDVIVSSELLETGRLLERGMAAPGLTTLISSISRAYTVQEKMASLDGRFDGERIQSAAAKATRTMHWLDMNALAADHGTVVSAVMFGALQGAGVLPWETQGSMAVMGEGRSAQASRAGFEAAMHWLKGQTASARVATADGAAQTLDEVMEHSRRRLRHYQDDAYVHLYEARITSLTSAYPQASWLTEAARRLALWMSYEDLARVAQLKADPGRFAELRKQAKVGEGELLEVREFFKPGLAEIAAQLPASAGRWLLAQQARRGWPASGKGRRVKSSGVLGRSALLLLSQMRRMRRSSLRFAQEQQAIEHWLDMVARAAALPLPDASHLAAQVVRMAQLRKGYSDTHARGVAAYERIRDSLVEPGLQNGFTSERLLQALTDALDAALTIPDGQGLESALAGHGIEPKAPQAKPVFWAKPLKRAG